VFDKLKNVLLPTKKNIKLLNGVFRGDIDKSMLGPAHTDKYLDLDLGQYSVL
jgi:hypothetical protein